MPAKFMLLLMIFIVGCGRFNNDHNAEQMMCGVKDWSRFSNRSLFRLLDPQGVAVSPASLGRAEFVSAESGVPEALSVSDGGCFALARGARGFVEVTVPAGDLGVHAEISPQRNRGMTELRLARVETLSLQLSCPENRHLSRADDLLLPFKAAPVTPGARFFLELAPSASKNKALIPARRVEEGYLPDVPAAGTLGDDSYSIRARAIDLLGRISESEICTLRLDSKVPAAPSFVGASVIRDDGALDFLLPAGGQGRICFEASSVPQDHCLREENFRSFESVVRLPGEGSWRVYAFSTSASGLRSPVRIWSAAADAKPPSLALRWQTPGLESRVAVTTEYGREYELHIDPRDDVSSQEYLGSHLECRVEFEKTFAQILTSPKARCTSGPCKGLPLDTFQKCENPLKFKIADEKAFWDHRVGVVVRVADEVGRASEAEKSFWMLKSALESGDSRFQWWTFASGSLGFQAGEESETVLDSGQILAPILLKSIKGSLLFGTRDGRFAIFRDNRWQHFPSVGKNAHAYFEDSKGFLWAAGTGAELFYMELGRLPWVWKSFVPSREHLVSERILVNWHNNSAFSEDLEGNLYFSPYSEREYWKIDPQRGRLEVKRLCPFSSGKEGYAFLDNSQRLWTLGERRSVSCFLKSQGWFPVELRLENVNMESLVETPSNEKYALSSTGLLLKFDEDRETWEPESMIDPSWETNNFNSGNRYQWLQLHPDGSLWLARTNKFHPHDFGRVLLRGEKQDGGWHWNEISLPKGTQSNSSRFLVLPDGQIWVGSGDARRPTASVLNPFPPDIAHPEDSGEESSPE